MQPPFSAKTFNIPALKGISAKTIEEHLKLYQGYVKNANLIYEKAGQYMKADYEGNGYAINELLRRLSFEFNGIRNHEVYFASLEGGPKAPSASSALRTKMESHGFKLEAWIEEFKKLAATMRGIGWAALVYEPSTDQVYTIWIDEQHLGHFSGTKMILGLDMWEHSYVSDYQPSGKKQYIEDFFANLNWGVIEKNLDEARKK
jgi:Fe-Mn family superoxide dismutase